MAASTPNKKPGLSLIEDEFWYAGAISERKAEQVLTKLEDKGSFLIRDSLLPDADYILSVKCSEDVDHYQVVVAPNNECVLNGYTFSTLPVAIEFYTENRIGKVFLNTPEEPVVPEAVAPKAVGPKIKYASISPAHHSPQLPQPIQTGPADPVIPVSPSRRNEMSTTTHLHVADSDAQSMNNPESQVLEQSTPGPTQTATTESSETISTDQTESITTRVEMLTLVGDTNPQTVPTAWQEQNPPTKPPPESNSPSKEPQCFSTEITESINHHSQLIDETPLHVCSEFPTHATIQDTSILKDGETIDETVLSVKELENVSVDANEEIKQSNQSQPAVCVQNVSSSLNNSPKQQEGTAASIKLPHTQPLKPPKDLKAEQQNELTSLPSIGDKKKALEKKLRGEVEKVENKKKVPPPIPKRTSTTTDLFKAHSTESKEEEPNPDLSVVKSSVKVTPPPAPKKLSIPLNFKQNSEEDSDKNPKATSPTEAPKRLVIPHSLQLQPPPPPLSTHPGLARKEEDRQQQLLQVEKERTQPQKSKKRNSFFKRKGKDSDKEKSGVKRKASFKADEPITLDEAEKQKQQQQEQDEAYINPSPPHRPKKVIGVPTLAISPVQLDASGGGGELESVFKTITKHEWRPEDGELNEEIEICASTFGQSSMEVVKQPAKSEPEKNEEPQKLEKKDTPKQKPRDKKNSIGDISGVSTFNPKVFSTAPEIQETNFTFTAPISTDIFLNTSFLKEGGNSQGTSTSSSPRSSRTPSSSPHNMNNSSTSSIGVTDTSSLNFVAQSPTALPCTPKTPNSSSSQSTISQNKPDDIHTTPNRTPPSSAPIRTTTSIPSSTHDHIHSLERDSSPKNLSKSQTSGSLPLGFVVTSTGNPTLTVNPFSRQHRSLVDVVPGIPSGTKSLPRGMSLDEIYEDVDSPAAGVRIPRSQTISSKKQDDKKSSINGPMNSKRIGNKKRSSVFKKNK